jgi:hypothetical protein
MFSFQRRDMNSVVMRPEEHLKYPKNLSSEERQEHWGDNHRRYMNRKNLKRREEELEALKQEVISKLSKISMMDLLITEEAWNAYMVPTQKCWQSISGPYKVASDPCWIPPCSGKNSKYHCT